LFYNITNYLQACELMQPPSLLPLPPLLLPTPILRLVLLPLSWLLPLLLPRPVVLAAGLLRRSFPGRELLRLLLLLFRPPLLLSPVLVVPVVDMVDV
jgi:hypothetical protein